MQIANTHQGVTNSISVPAEINFGIDETLGWYGNFQLPGGKHHAAEKTGRPAGGEHLLRICPGADGAGDRQPDIQASIIAVG